MKGLGQQEEEWGQGTGHGAPGATERGAEGVARARQRRGVRCADAARVQPPPPAVGAHARPASAVQREPGQRPGAARQRPASGHPWRPGGGRGGCAASGDNSAVECGVGGDAEGAGETMDPFQEHEPAAASVERGRDAGAAARRDAASTELRPVGWAGCGAHLQQLVVRVGDVRIVASSRCGWSSSGRVVEKPVGFFHNALNGVLADLGGWMRL